MTLDQLAVGKSATITTVGGEGALRQHFLNMGVIPGAEVTLVKLAPMGDPMELRLHGYELTLRVSDAREIGIKDVREAAGEHAHPRAPMAAHPGLGEGGRYHVKAGENPLPAGTTSRWASMAKSSPSPKITSPA